MTFVFLLPQGDDVQKAVFIIFFQGDQLKSRVKKICEGFRATIYPCPDSPQERREMSIGVMTRIEDLKTVLGQTQDHRHRVLVVYLFLLLHSRVICWYFRWPRQGMSEHG
jgi:vacuolar-type H+-ATPase subunit I/STV1